MAAPDLAVSDLASLGPRSAVTQLVVELELGAGADEVDGDEPDVLEPPLDAAFVSDFVSDFVSVFVSGFFSLAAPSPLDALLLGA